MIEAVIFDRGGVIVNNTDTFVFKDISKAFGIGQELAVSTLLKFLKDFQAGKISESEFWSRFSRDIGKDLPKDYRRLWIREYASNSKTNKDVQKVIDRLRLRGYKLALLSNTIPPHARYNCKNHNFKRFDSVVLSCDVGMIKPDEEIYRLVMKKLGVSPKKCVFIDDVRKNLKPAKRLGMKTILFRSAEQMADELKKMGVIL